jgi:hypothetical protein
MYNCSQCDKEIEIVDSFNYPLYYFGAGPNNPQDAEVYFCGADCAYKHKKSSRDDDK